MKAFLLIMWLGLVLVDAATFSPPTSSASGVTVDPVTHILIYPTDLGSANGFGGSGSSSATNLGTGWHMFAQKSGGVLQFNTITNDAWLATSSNGNTVTIALGTQFKIDVNATSNSVLTTLAGLVTTSNQVATVQAGLVTTSNRVEVVNTAAVPTTRILGTTAPLTGGGDLSANRTLALAVASDSVNGYLSAVDHVIFNGKAGSVNKLSFFAATTSAELLGVISDESGSGAVLGGTSPTIITPTISGAIAFQAGTRQTFAPNGTASGFNPGSVAGDPSTLVNGDIWYDSSSSHLRARIAGATVLLGTGGGAGTVGTMISTGASTATSVPGYTDTTSTNLAPVETSGTGLIARTFAPALTNVVVQTNLTVNYPGIGATPQSGLILSNATAAAAGAQQEAPALEFAGNGYKTSGTAASQTARFRMRNTPVQGASNPTATFNLESSINGGAYGNAFTFASDGTFNSFGTVNAGGAVTAQSGINTGASLVNAATGLIYFGVGQRTTIQSPADGQLAIISANTVTPASLLSAHNAATKTGNYTVLALESGSTFNNTGAGGTIIFTLPTPTAGLFYTFYADAAQVVTLTATGSATIRNGATVTGANGSMSSSATTGSCITIEAISTTKWITRAVVLTWN